MECKDCEKLREELRKEVTTLTEEIAVLQAKYATLNGFIKGISFVLGGVGVIILVIKDIIFDKH